VRILVAHVGYREEGGEDAVFAREVGILRRAAHEVYALNPKSAEFTDLGLPRKLAIGWSRGDHMLGRRMIREAVDEFRPDVVHFHNLYPTLGVGAILEAKSMGCATVRTYHNYRTSCLVGTHTRQGLPCEACGPTKWGRGVLRGCYRGSRLQSVGMSLALGREWTAFVSGVVPDVAICVSDFMRQRFVAAGAPEATVRTKVNSVEFGEPLDHSQRWGVIFVGRLSPEKGIGELVNAWQPQDPPLGIAGSGPQEGLVRQLATRASNVHVLGATQHQQVRQLIRTSRVLVFPSRCYEGMPLTVLESLAEGTPVVAYRQGVVTGLGLPGADSLVTPGDVQLLRRRALQTHWLEKDAWNEISKACVQMHALRYADEVNLRELEKCYLQAVNNCAGCAAVMPS
jgi:glycosyltransferase involved in cell wall biosynthesis